MDSPQKDVQTVTPEGESVAPIIQDVQLRYATTHPDERGSVTEIFDPRWGFTDEPMVYLYEFTIRPGIVKGWIKHEQQTDRVFLQRGSLRVVLYDDRPDSPTYQILNQFTFTEHNRGMICYPSGVYHALENVGTTDVICLNTPTRAYNHEDPDKYRLPLDNDLIPFKFRGKTGW
jgi:dTDP-4-dehydrorhamnose 3,5-epimerase